VRVFAISPRLASHNCSVRLAKPRRLKRHDGHIRRERRPVGNDIAGAHSQRNPGDPGTDRLACQHMDRAEAGRTRQDTDNLIAQYPGRARDQQ